MTSITTATLRLPSAALDAENPLPPVAGVVNVQQQTQTFLDEDDELFIGYGFLNGSYPYRQQDGYGEALEMTDVQTVVLENEFLRAEFLPGYGGRLRSLFDKAKGRELLFCNPVLRPRNLAVRNAWMSGGVEWNCGLIGHSPYTCSPVFTARTQLADGTPVLRMYEFERIRAVVYQMDFFLPEGSRVLYARMRIVNPRKETLPMYWWSNIAVAEDPRARVIIPAVETYTNRHNAVSKTTVPVSRGVDITYPCNNRESIDFFWKLQKGARPFICHLDAQGYGLLQASTARLQGRKLFVWGQQPGSAHWERLLSGAGCEGKYVEIQAGLAHTQYECIPMPPETAWEWLEAYGPLQADGERVHGEWAGAVRETQACAEALAPAAKLEALLNETREMSKTPAPELLQRGGGWGALERLRRERQGERPMCPHLDFGETGPDQGPWERLLETGSLGALDARPTPESWMSQPEWLALLESATRGADSASAYAHLQLGMALLAGGAPREAKEHLLRSLECQPSPWALYGLGQLARLEGDMEAELRYLHEAALAAPKVSALSVPYLQALLAYERPADALAFAQRCPEAVQAAPRIRLYTCEAMARAGHAEQAQELLQTLNTPDIRENEISMTELWFLVEEGLARQAGRAFDRATATPPAWLDYRTMDIPQ